ncbi:hypothetical protein GCM10023317_79800 [Actinopolymorpha pittospori]
MPFQSVRDAAIDTRMGKSWNAATPTTIGPMNSQPVTLRRNLACRSLGAIGIEPGPDGRADNVDCIRFRLTGSGVIGDGAPGSLVRDADPG